MTIKLKPRTDIHRPSAIIPAEYDFVGYAYEPKSGNVLLDCAILNENRARLAAHKARTGGAFSTHEHGGTCHVCGAWAIYRAVFHHRPTNTYIYTGFDCADKMGIDSGAGECFRSHIHNALEARAGKAKAQALLADKGLDSAWAVYQAPTPQHQLQDRNGSYTRSFYEESTIKDIVGKLVKWGSISEKQYAFVGKLLVKISERGAVEASREAEKAAAKPLPVTQARVHIQGKVLSTKVQDTRFGYQTKMLVQAADGWKVWGTVPVSLTGVERGVEVEFEAAIVPSNDPKFGFFNRPTNGRVI